MPHPILLTYMTLSFFFIFLSANVDSKTGVTLMALAKFCKTNPQTRRNECEKKSVKRRSLSTVDEK